MGVWESTDKFWFITPKLLSSVGSMKFYITTIEQQLCMYTIVCKSCENLKHHLEADSNPLHSKFRRKYQDVTFSSPYPNKLSHQLCLEYIHDWNMLKHMHCIKLAEFDGRPHLETHLLWNFHLLPFMAKWKDQERIINTSKD